VPSIVAVDKTPAVAEKINGATLKLTRSELELLKYGLEYAYKAHKADFPGYYVGSGVSTLYKTVKAAYEGKTAPESADALRLKLQDQINRAYTSARVF
jgi:hypothetical protein